MSSSQMILQGNHNPWLVSLAVIIAIIASYSALQFTARITQSDINIRKMWLWFGAITMGGGIWAMHSLIAKESEAKAIRPR